MSYSTASATASARDFFPRGLQQPEKGFRFSVDALLLSCFAQVPAGGRLLDLGAGCGVVGIGCLLRQMAQQQATDGKPAVSVLSLDVQPEMIAFCKGNFAALGLQEGHETLLCDVRDIRSRQDVCPESMDAVVCNPPYRRPESGKTSDRLDREKALAETEGGGLVDFLAATAYVLKNRASAYFVFTARRLSDFVVAARGFRLEPKALRFVHGTSGSVAKTVLIQVVKNGRPDVVVLPPLILYGEGSGGRKLTLDAQDFCPFLGGHASRGGGDAT
ncbi:MAG: tRNA1(Val) (adenine(37)-N6)-methyltransferase [Desulfovibrio sp.]|uniref:tRNA1(Val) (adenine(37)-N6)-methyltransferase n=1 Tax=Desulfovibrio sp. 7SRBS1 TaxID=3378064 RepID=UPI003B3F6E2E